DRRLAWPLSVPHRGRPFRRGLVVGATPFAFDHRPVDVGLLPLRTGAHALLPFFYASQSLAFTFCSRALAFVRAALSFVCPPLAIICDSVPLISDPISS